MTYSTAVQTTSFEGAQINILALLDECFDEMFAEDSANAELFELATDISLVARMGSRNEAIAELNSLSNSDSDNGNSALTMLIERATDYPSCEEQEGDIGLDMKEW